MRIALIASLILVAACSADPGRKTSTSPRNGGTARPTRPALKPASPDALEPGTIAIGDVVLRVEVAADDVTRGVGLSDRDAVEDGAGMLFVYPSAGLRSFWMKGCRIGLDIAYLDDDRRIIQLGSLDPPGPGTTDEDMPRFRSASPARFVVETGKGWMRERGIAVGDRVRFSADIETIVEGVERP